MAYTASTGHQAWRNRGLQHILMTWLHHRSYGTLGIYLNEPPETVTSALESRQWIQLSGIFQPCMVHAHASDPRSARRPDQTLLVIATTRAAITTIRIGDVPTPEIPLLAQQQHARLLAGKRCAHGYVAPLAQQPDITYWQACHIPPPPVIAWNCLLGVVSTYDVTRYLRYVVSTAPEK